MKLKQENFSSKWGILNNRIALNYTDRRNGQRKNILFVFTEVSAKRITNPHYRISKMNKTSNENYKVILVNNKALMDFNHEYAHAYFDDIRELVFDGKLGQSFETRSEEGHLRSCGPYFHCLSNAKTSVKPRIRPRSK